MPTPEETNNKKEKEVEEEITLKIPVQLLVFADFYANLGDEERDALLKKILIERLKELREQVKSLPYLDIPEFA